MPGEASSPSAPRVVAVDLHPTQGLGVQALRLLCLADVARRTLEEVDGAPARLVVLGGRPELRTAARGLGVVVDDAPGPSGPPSSVLPDVQVLVTPDPVSGAGRDAPPSRRTVLVGAVATAASSATSRGGVDPVTELVLGDPDPLALRLALLRPHPREAITLSAARRHRAAQTLERWRFKVAGWKEMPVVAAPPELLEAVHGALSDALDTGTALQLLHRMEVDHDVPSGAKFSTFLVLDRILALDLKRMVGRVPW